MARLHTIQLRNLHVRDEEPSRRQLAPQIGRIGRHLVYGLGPPHAAAKPNQDDVWSRIGSCRRASWQSRSDHGRAQRFVELTSVHRRLPDDSSKANVIWINMI